MEHVELAMIIRQADLVMIVVGDKKVGLGRDLQEMIWTALEAYKRSASTEIFEASRKRIEDYDRREAAGEDVSGEVRPRMPGGSDF